MAAASSSFDLDDFDDGPTSVTVTPAFYAPVTEVMDRRQLPPISGVMPIAAPRPRALPRTASSPDMTQPALRVRRDLAGTRRLAVGLAIGLAFVFGLSGAFVFQTMSANADAAAAWSTPARAPRSVTERSSTLDTKSTPDALPRSEAPPASAPRAQAKRTAAPSTTDVGEAAPENESLDGRDLLGEGLGAP